MFILISPKLAVDSPRFKVWQAQYTKSALKQVKLKVYTYVCIKYISMSESPVVTKINIIVHVQVFGEYQDPINNAIFTLSCPKSNSTGNATNNCDATMVRNVICIQPSETNDVLSCLIWCVCVRACVFVGECALSQLRIGGHRRHYLCESKEKCYMNQIFKHGRVTDIAVWKRFKPRVLTAAVTVKTVRFYQQCLAQIASKQKKCFIILFSSKFNQFSFIALADESLIKLT